MSSLASRRSAKPSKTGALKRQHLGDKRLAAVVKEHIRGFSFNWTPPRIAGSNCTTWLSLVPRQTEVLELMGDAIIYLCLHTIVIRLYPNVPNSICNVSPFVGIKSQTEEFI